MRRATAAEWGGRIALLAGGFLGSMLFVELVVRLIEPPWSHRESFETADPVVHHKFIPNARGRYYRLNEFDTAYVINSLGLRDTEVSREKPAGVLRILMLGDSFTEGNGVEAEETFSSQLEAMLGQTDAFRPCQVINAGVGSYSTLLEYLYLKNGGLALQPDLVILNFDLSDVYDDIQYARLATLDAKGDPVAVTGVQPKGSWPFELLVAFKNVVKKHTRAYGFVRTRIDVGRIRHKQDFSGDVRLDKYGMLREDVGPADDRAWSLTYETLLRIRDLLAARGVDFWVALYPYGIQVSPREWGSGRRWWGFESGRVYSTRPQELMAQFCRANRIAVVDTCEDLKQASRSVYPLYFDVDGHWRPVGHQVVARALNRALVPYLQERRASQATPGPAAPQR